MKLGQIKLNKIGNKREITIALIKKGSFNDFKVKAKPEIIKTKSVYSSIRTFNEIG
ncbi:MAG TPA: hypothetical protein VIK14_03450 [Ignavibacteria bacterium]